MGTSTPLSPAADASRTPDPSSGRHGWRVRLLALLGITGPGLVADAAGNDAGGIATYTCAGAQFGHHTLFLMVFVTAVLALVQEMCARLRWHTGEGLGSLLREQFSLRITAVVLVAFLVANLGAMVSEFGGIGVAFELVGVGRFVSVQIASSSAWPRFSSSTPSPPSSRTPTRGRCSARRCCPVLCPARLSCSCQWV